jgi:TonB family protein
MNRWIVLALAGASLAAGSCATATSQSLPEPPNTEGQVTIGPLDRGPVLIQQAQPRYPRGAFDRGIEGTVELEILVDETGDVIKTRIIKSIPELDAAAIQAVRQWKFKPALMGGHPVATVASAPVVFRITEKK